MFEILKDLLEDATILSIDKIETRDSICGFKVNKNNKIYSFTLCANDLGTWIENKKDESGCLEDFQDFIEETFKHLSNVENYKKNIYEAIDFPMEKAIGFKCKKCGKIFKLSLNTIKKSKYGELLQTLKQRKAFAKVLSKDYIYSKESLVQNLSNMK